MTTGARTGRKTFVVVSHTHWDREWYQPFETFRVRLVRMMDSLLDLFQRDPDFKHFALDGQTIPVDDYLEVRPERRYLIERLIREGRLLIGPNYILPDEFLIGAESWVRNLQIGIRSAREYGAVMTVGYSPDAFGHIAHLPAILRGFGLDSVLIWRGVSREVPTSEFRWRAPDGSEVLVAHLAHGYGYMAVVPDDREGLVSALASMRSTLEPLATTSHVLVPNGTDHMPARDGLSRVIRDANEILDGGVMRHGTYPEFVASVRAELGQDYEKLPLVTGELRSSERSHVLAGVLSARMWLKRKYARCEDLLSRYAEPLSAWAHMQRRDRPDLERTASDKGLLHHAWKLLLQNGPHDSVTGCSVDAVYDDVGLRFQKCDQIAEAVAFEAQRQLAQAAAKPGQDTVFVYNGEHGPRTDFCTVQMPIEAGRLPVGIVDDAGSRTPVQIVARGIHSPRDPRERIVIGFVARAVPGFGYKSYAVEYGEPEDPPEGSSDVIENEYFAVRGGDDGTLTIEDRRSGRVLRGLNRFVDSGDRGDEYTYCPPERDVVVDSPASVKVRVIETGPARQTLDLRMVYRLPASITGDRQARATELVDCEIVTLACLYPGVARVDIETEVDNRAEDHRLRVLFPTGVVASTSRSEQHFGVVEREAAAQPMQPEFPETPVASYPQKTFTDVSDGTVGIMLANRGLPEYELVPDGNTRAAIALTLLRCVGWLSREDLSTRPGNAGPSFSTPGAQMIGRWKFEYSIIPHEGGWEQAFGEAHSFARPLRAIRVSSGTREMPAEASLLSVDPAKLVVSAVRLAQDDDSLVVGAYNIANEPIEASLSVDEPHGEVFRVDMNEENAEDVVASDGVVRLALLPNEIVTLKIAT
jgi:2-O-(6-phospho-alpha-D-mannosyl)-D-glycerate hydrolase